MRDIKQKLLLTYIQEKLVIPKARQGKLIKKILPLMRIQHAIKYQVLEAAGPADTGRAWLAMDAMAHSYYFNDHTKTHVGTHIWNKNEPILFHGSLFHDHPRAHAVQMLQPGHVLSIGYGELLDLRNEFSEIAEHLEALSIQKEKAFQDRIILLNQPKADRIMKFEAENPAFHAIASSTIKAMHVGLCRQTYNAVRKRNTDPDHKSDHV